MYVSRSSLLNSRFAYSDTSHWAKRKNCDSIKFLRILLTFSILDLKILFGTFSTNIHKVTSIVTAWRTQVLPTNCVKYEPGEDLLRRSLRHNIIILLGRFCLEWLNVIILLQALVSNHHTTRNHISEYNNLNPHSTLFTRHWEKFSQPYKPRGKFNITDKTTKFYSTLTDSMHPKNLSALNFLTQLQLLILFPKSSNGICNFSRDLI